ncbi:hypothetical protein B0O99DRAFT_599818 [Bisporella sp. PMI_857]|nr:hypothetical protein B0O99DRAFT_599818 [Bisporella sp. PMI_857]
MQTGTGDAVQSCPIDLNHVSARLGEMLACGESSSRLSSAGASIDMDNEEYDHYLLEMEMETGFYNEPMNGGSRPSHQPVFGYDVAKNLLECCEILSFRQTSSGARMLGNGCFHVDLGRGEVPTPILVPYPR